MALACTWEAPPSLYPVTFALLGVVSLQPRSHLEENLKQGRAARRGQEGNSVKGPVRCEDRDSPGPGRFPPARRRRLRSDVALEAFLFLNCSGI